VSTLLNAGYFLPIVYRAFFCAPTGRGPNGHDGSSADPENNGYGGHGGHGEAPWPMVVALVATAAGTVLLFLLPDVALTLARQVMGGG
jgi:multicomponent Na+:H+ antiporter subunit D